MDCCYIFSEDSDITVQRIEETIYICPKFYTSLNFRASEIRKIIEKPNGRSLILFYCEVVAQNRLDSIIVLYPNILKSYTDLSNRIREGKDKNIPKYSISRLFGNNLDYMQVLKRLPFEILKITFENTLKKEENIKLLLRFESTNASTNDSDFHSSNIDFTISGPLNVKRSFEQGLVGANGILQEFKDNSVTSLEKEAYSKLLDATKDIERRIIDELTQHKTTFEKWGILLIYSPKLGNIKLDMRGNLEKVAGYGIPDVTWPFQNFWDKIALAKKIPSIHAFVFERKKHKEPDFLVDSTAFMRKPTQLYLSVLAILLALLSIILRS